jgi:hypothetical protein
MRVVVTFSVDLGAGAGAGVGSATGASVATSTTGSGFGAGRRVLRGLLLSVIEVLHSTGMTPV